jgi:hydrophobe/amphiphile efflux-1 (HAE1) family protein
MTLGRWSARHPVLIGVVFLFLVLVGTWALRRLPLDLFPEVELPSLTVVVVYPGATSVDVEDRVTRPIEDAVTGVAGIEDVVSTSTDNIGAVTCIFEEDIDLDGAASDIREKLGLIRRTLPEGIDEPSIYKFDVGSMPVVILAVTAEVGDVDDWTETVRVQVVEGLQRVSGVGSVTVTNPAPEEVHVDLNRARLEQQGLSLSQVGMAIQAQNLSIPMGSLVLGGLDYGVRLPAEFTSLEDLRSLVVGASRSGGVVRLRDVAQVSIGPAERQALSQFEGRPAQLVMVQKRSGANVVDVAQQVQDEIERINPTLPHGLHVSLVADTSRFVQRMVDALTESVYWGGLFVVLVVFLFLRRIRSSLVVALAIPSSMMVVFAVLHFTGNTLNIISLIGLALAIGMVVDNAIVVLENVERHLRDGKSREDAASEGLREVVGAVVASTLTTVVVYAPLGLMVSGVIGVLAAQFASVMITAVTASLAVSLLLTPMLCALLLKSKAEQRPPRNRVGRAIERLHDLSERGLLAVEHAYGTAAGWSARHKWVVLLLCAGLVGLTVRVVVGGGMNFMPAIDSGDVVIYGRLPVGASTARTAKVARQVERILREEAGPDLQHAYWRAGRSEEGSGILSGQKEGTYIFQVGGRLRPQVERVCGSVAEMGDRIRRRLDRIPDLVTYQVQTRNSSMSQMFGTTKPIAVEISGMDLDRLREASAAVERVVREVPGTTEVVAEGIDLRPELEVRMNRLRASLLGLNTWMAGDALRTALHGSDSGVYRGTGIRAQEADIVVRLRAEDRDSVADIETFSVPSVTGAQIRLANVAEVEERSVPVEITRKNRARVMLVTAYQQGSTLDEISAGIRAGIKKLKLPQDVTVELGGELEQQVKVMGDLSLAVLASILLIYMVMAGQYGTLRDPLVVMFSVPFAFTGIFIGMDLLGIKLSVISILGLIMLLGIVVNNAIVLVDYINLMRAEQHMTILEAVVVSGRRRLRPILMTMLTTMFGMVPMVLAVGEGHELWQELGTAMICGLSVSTFVTLFLVPVVYVLFHWPEARRERKRAQAAPAGESAATANG